MNDITIYNDNGVQRVQLAPDMARDLRTLQQFQITLQEMKNMEQDIKERVSAVMDEYNIDSFELDGIKFTKKKAHTRTTIDSKRLKEEFPEVAKECSKVTQVAGSMTIDYGY